MSKVKKFSTKLDAGLSAAQVLADSMASHHLVQQLYNNGKGLVVTNHINGITQKRPHSAISPVKSNGHSTGLVQNAINGLHKNTNGNVIINGAINGSSNGSAHQQPSILKSKSIVPPPISAESSSMSSILNNSTDYADQFSGFSILADAASAAASVNGSTSSSFDTTPFHTPSKRRKTDSKNGKGLRHFSMKVCEKVKVKGVTTYNEVADELVAEFTADPQMGLGGGGFGEGEPFDQKNIRRRVYDALNVLMAMNIISKEKKEIRWIGLPSNCTQECYELEREKQERIKRIDLKKQQLRDLLVQQIAFKNLVERNRNFSTPPSTSAIIQLPFIIVNTDKRTVIDCSISNDKTEYLFNFDNTFEIHDDIEVLKRIGLACGLDKDGDRELDHKKLDKIRQMLPEALRAELDEMIEQKMRHSDGNALTDSQAPSDLVITNSELDSSSFYSITSATH